MRQIVSSVYVAGEAIPYEDRGDPPIEGGLFCSGAELAEGAESLPVLVPTFNEEASELWMSLKSLVEQQKHAVKYTFEICIILDGWVCASDSMKSYLQQLFPTPTSSSSPLNRGLFPTVTNWTEPLNTANGNDNDLITVVIESVQESSPHSSSRVPIVLHPPDCPDEPLGRMHVTLVVKRENRRKFNSHMWFLAPHSFTSSCRSSFLLLTDCGTIFCGRALSQLLDNISAHPHAVSSVAIQVQMPAQEQGMVPEPLFAPYSFLRAAVGMDYLTRFLSAGWLSMFGCTKIIPGACGLFRLEFLKGETLRIYFAMLKQPPHQGGLISGNGCLVEDMLLTYLVLIAGDVAPQHRGRLHISSVPSAWFYFPLEESFQKFMGQRRRWINGVTSIYLWLASDFRLLWSSSRISCSAKAALTYVVLSSILFQVMILTLPFVFTHTISQLLALACHPSLACSSWFLVFLLALLVVFCVRHAASPTCWIPGTILLSCIFAFNSVVTFIIGFASAAWTPIEVGTPGHLSVGLLLMGCHLFTILLIDPAFMWDYIRGFVPYFLLFPFIQAVTTFYSVPLTWYLQWGNRPSNHMSFVADQQSQKRIQRSFRVTSAIFLAIALIFPLLLGALVISNPSSWDSLSFAFMIIFCVTQLSQSILTTLVALKARLYSLCSLFFGGSHSHAS